MNDLFDVLTIGRIGVDIYPTEPGSLVDVKVFEKYLGGSPTNVAVAAARLGERSAVISRTGPDPFGKFIHVALRGYGVDDRYVTDVEGFQTPVTFCEIIGPDSFPLYFYREPKAPDLEIYSEELDREAIVAARLFWATVSGLSVEPSRSSTLEALAVRARRHPTVLDLDWRPTFWKSPDNAGALTREALGLVTVAIGNLSEVEMAAGTSDPDVGADRLLDLGLELVIVKMGPNGVMGKTRDERVDVAPMQIDVVNGLGAGDGFGGALCHALLAGWSLERILRFANAAGAIVASRLACSEAMPTIVEIDELLKGKTNA